MNTDSIVNEEHKTQLFGNTFELSQAYYVIRGFKIFHLYIRSIAKHFDELTALLHDKTILFYIIILTETQLKATNELFNITGYTTHHFPSKITTHDGFTIIIKNYILNSLTINATCEITQANAVTINLAKHKQTFSILAVYRSPPTNVKLFIDEITTQLTY